MKKRIVVEDWKSKRHILVVEDDYSICNNDIEDYFREFKNIDCLFAIRNRASVNEVITFANKIRNAGGADIINELMPSIPEEPNSCLIANALNFDCEVNTDINGNWTMSVYDYNTGINIAENLGMEYCSSEDDNVVIIDLPERIGLVAEAFDSFCDAELEEYNASNKGVSFRFTSQ